MNAYGMCYTLFNGMKLQENIGFMKFLGGDLHIENFFIEKGIES